MPDLRHRFAIRSEPQRLYGALTEQRHVSAWWTERCRLEARLGATAEFHWPAHGWRVEMLIERLEPGRLVQWRCLESNMQGTDAWRGTLLSFRIEPSGEGSTLDFEQIGYRDSPCLQECDPGWAYALGTSLKAYLETGTGRPYRSPPS